MSTVLVTGGAGYIGSHMVQALRRAGYRTVVYDNLSEGHLAAVKNEELIEGDLTDKGTLRAALRRHRPSAILHFAAVCSVAESVENPLKYYRNNVVGTATLIETALEVGVPRFILSSTAAVYGEPNDVPITEDHPLNPVNPYGTTKWICERMLADASAAYGSGFVAFRYFNAAGCDATAGLGEDHDPETHLIPLAVRAVLEEDCELKVFGTDYDTRDGSCIRDYVHVLDLCEAHLLGLKRLEGGGDNLIVNLGTTEGTSVLEVIESVERISGASVPHTLAERRPGDPARLIASNQRAKEELGWEPRHGLDDMITSAYDFMRRLPNGYPQGSLGDMGLTPQLDDSSIKS